MFYFRNININNYFRSFIKCINFGIVIFLHVKLLQSKKMTDISYLTGKPIRPRT